jgi:glycosyltransferase involved in cell wall biosynthesis
VRIGVNTRLLLEGKLTGIGWFTCQTLKWIVDNNPEHEFFFFFDRPAHEQFVFAPNVHPIVLSPKARHPILFRIWMDFMVKRKAKSLKLDAFISPEGMLPLGLDVPILTVVHDLNFEHYPKDLAASHSKYYRKFFPKFCAKAKRIATVSEFSKQDIVAQYGMPEDKIDVVYNGVNDCFKPMSKQEISDKRKQLSGGDPYFVFIGMLHPRKNIHRLFQAFNQFRLNTKSTTKLVIVGEKLWWDVDMEKAFEALEFKADVIFTGHLSSEELVPTLGAAEALTYVPYFEGFGIPILEGFKCDVPVITSNRTSMPEVAGNAAILVDPFSVDAIAWAMKNVSEDSALRKRLIANGRERLEMFSWEKSGKLLWNSFSKMMESKD